MANKREKLSTFINRFRIAVVNAQSNAEISAAMGLFGYDALMFAEGQALLDRLIALSQQQQTEQAEKLAATESLNTAWQAANQRYGVHRSIAKRVFKDNGLAWNKLTLNEQKAASRIEGIQQAALFYKNLLGDASLMQAMTKFGQTQAILEAAEQAIQEVVNLMALQKKESAEAQIATQTRDEVWAESKTWLATMLEIARYALVDNPQLIEALGVVEPS